MLQHKKFVKKTKKGGIINVSVCLLSTHPPCLGRVMQRPAPIKHGISLLIELIAQASPAASQPIQRAAGSGLHVPRLPVGILQSTMLIVPKFMLMIASEAAWSCRPAYFCMSAAHGMPPAGAARALPAR